MGWDPSVSRQLTDDQCWGLLRAEEFGRLAFLLGAQVHLVPVNYAVDEDTLLFRTGEGEKLLGVTMHPEVVLEIDHYNTTLAQSVLVRGQARVLDESEEHRAENVPLRPWVSTPKYNVVEIRPTQVTGMEFDLERPWLHLRDPEGGDRT